MATALAETIAAQPEQLELMLGVSIGDQAQLLLRARRIWLVGTGTSQHAAELGAMLLAQAGRDARWCSSAAFARGGEQLGALDAADAVIVISHTTESAFASAARERTLQSGAGLVSITGIGRGWPEAIETVPAERSETYTASYTAALVVLARLSLTLGSPALTDGDLARVPAETAAAIAAAEHDQAVVPERVLVIAGAGPAAVTAREGALKVREAARVLSEGYEAEYLLHGTAVPLDRRDRLLLLAPESEPDGLLSALGSAAEAEGLSVGQIGSSGALPPLLAQIPLTVRLQLLALRYAGLTGHNPDKVIVGRWAADELWSAGRH